MSVITVDPTHALFDQWARVFTAAGEDEWGRHHTAYSADELRAFWRKNSTHRHGFAVLDAGADSDGLSGGVAAAAIVSLPQRDNPHLAFVDVATHPDRRGRGHGSAVLAAAEAFVAHQGRTTIFVETQTPAGADDAARSFAQSHGYTVGQVVARNGQRHPVSPEVRRRMVEALAREDGYSVTAHVGELPEHVLDGRARLGAMMSTDTPLGDLDLRPETVDAQRVRDELRAALAAGRIVVTGIATHEASGEIVGYSVVEVSAATPWIGYQDDTLVVTDHRGHDLGFRLKAAVATALEREAPDLEVIRTWNDETNAPMLAVNTRLGYEREGTMREWQKKLG